MTRSEKIAKNRADKRIDEAYRRSCSGVQVPILSIGSIFDHGHKLIAAGADESALEAGIVAFVETVRTN